MFDFLRFNQPHPYHGKSMKEMRHPVCRCSLNFRKGRKVLHSDWPSTQFLASFRVRRRRAKRRTDGTIMDRTGPPEFPSDFERRDLEVGPPCRFIAMTMQVVVMRAADRDSKFVTDLAAHRLGLSKFEVVRVARQALAY
jgi:hypothetical protein